MALPVIGLFKVTTNVWEWELLTQPLILTEIIGGPKQYLPANSQLKIYRDEDYRIYADLTGQSTGAMPHLASDGEEGRFVSDLTLQAQDEGFHYHFETPGFSRPSFNSGGEYKCRSPITRITAQRKAALKEPVFYLSDWYVGKRIDSFSFGCFSQGTVSEAQKIKHRPHESLDSEAFDYKKYGAIRDHFIVTLKNYTFIVQEVPKEYAPAFAHGFVLKFSQAWGGIPEVSEREALAEVIGFFLGSPLIKVGSSNYNKEYELIESSAQLPMAPNPRERCKGSGFSPVPRTSDWRQMSEHLRQFIPSYLEQRDSLSLNRFLQLYWLAIELPSGIDIPIFSTALEMLANAFNEAYKTGGTGVYLPEKDFNTLFEEELKSIAQKIAELKIPEPDKNAMGDKFKNAYQRGHAQTLKGLYRHLGIKLTQLEKDALAQRHKMTHGSATKNRDELEQKVLYARACHSFLNRILLKVLGYKGEYTDFYTQGLPSRPVEQGIPKPASDKNQSRP